MVHKWIMPRNFKKGETAEQHSQSESDWLNYKQSRNNVSKLVRESKKSYFNKKNVQKQAHF